MAPPGIGDSVEGRHAVAAALDAGRVRRLLVSGRGDRAPDDLVARAQADGIPVERVPDLETRATTGAPQGVIAVCTPIHPVPLANAVGRAHPAALLVLDHLEDPRNVGAIARSAVGAGFTGLVYGKRRSAPLGATAFKAAVGALERLDLVEVSSVASAVDELKDLEVWTVGLDSGGEPLERVRVLVEPVALVVGAEGGGLARLVRDRVDVVASLPMEPGVESLNAAVAASLAMFEVRRARR